VPGVRSVLRRRLVADHDHANFTVPQTTFGVTVQLMEHKGRGTSA